MRNMQTVTIPERTEERCASLTCDICGAVSPDDAGWATGYGIDEIKVSRRQGAVYPDGGRTVVESFHLCPDCWTGQLVPWLKSQGAQPTVEEADW